jgi:hypothetical protein
MQQSAGGTERKPPEYPRAGVHDASAPGAEVWFREPLARIALTLVKAKLPEYIVVEQSLEV